MRGLQGRWKRIGCRMTNPAINRYVRAEKAAGYAGDWQRAQRIALHVWRSCALYGYTRNPY